MVWISLILVSLLFVFYVLWPKKRTEGRVRVPKKYNVYDSDSSIATLNNLEQVVYFDGGSAKLEDQEVLKLKEWMSPFLKQMLDSVCLIGSADTTGNLAKNRKLVQQRIQSVRKILTTCGVSKDKIKTISLEPIFGKTPQERKLYRSVEIKVSMKGPR